MLVWNPSLAFGESTTTLISYHTDGNIPCDRYFIISGLQVLYAYYVEGHNIYQGKRKLLSKRVSRSLLPTITQSVLALALQLTPESLCHRSKRNSYVSPLKLSPPTQILPPHIPFTYHTVVRQTTTNLSSERKANLSN